MNKEKKFYGAGFEWTAELEDEDPSYLHGMKCFELIPENFFNLRYKRIPFLKYLGDLGTPTLLHAVETSIGSPEPLKQQHFDRIKWLADQINCVEISDHLCMTEAGGLEIGQLTTLPFNEDVVDNICRKIDQIQSQVDVPFAIENITNLFYIPDCEYTETQFINKILHRTGCHFLLDITNLYTISVNHKIDPIEWLNQVDLNHVSTIHLAGGYYDEDNWLVDAHGRDVPEEAWKLMDYALSKTGPVNVIIERTNDMESLEKLLGEVHRAQSVLDNLKIAPQMGALL